MKPHIHSPRITHLCWGKIEIEGQQHLKDAKCFPGGSTAWDWGETGTHHVPGIQPSDVKELLEHGATCLVLSTGFLGKLKISTDTFQQLIPVHVRQTQEAVALYNKLTETEQVGALFHSTC
ncbi:MAG TPA: hypothetical protein ENG03_00765 [Thioploca sp.]|nr:MAG: hypothetical protein DRR19_14520 [Gammaproteobacteria bacterium]HDN25632.1 hypothetical protein [Thioploca sp.]